MAKDVKSLPNGKTCGLDGLPIEIYKMFWSRIKEDFCQLVNENYVNRHMNRSALHGVINMIPKKDKNTKFLKFLRPITVLTSDYKVIEKMLANRIELALNDVISHDQRGFRKNKRICCNIRTIFELIKYTDAKNIDALILSLDFEKCFDKIEFCAIIGSLKFFEFPQYIIDWVDILYTDFMANTQNNGHFSARFPVNRGVHQGGPCSSLLFLICAEVLALTLKNDQNIQGIPVEEILKLFGQYADDADLFLLKNQQNLECSFRYYGKIS